MRIKKFLASSIKEATEQMKEDLGSDAIVLNTRRLPKDNPLKVFGKDQFEITGAVDELPERAPASASGTYSRRAVRQSFEAVANAFNGQQSEDHEPQEFTPAPRTALPPSETPVKRSSAAMREVSDITQLKADVEDMKGMLQQLSHQLKYKHFGDLPEFLKEVYLNLLQQDVDEKFAIAITNTVLKKLHPQRIESRHGVEQLVLQTIAADFPAAPAPASRKKTRVVVLVGPTGVGKTTTIAKMAAIEKLANGKSVGLISCDTYRIGAIEQLKTFAVIADIPMQVVYRASDVAAAVKKYQKFDVVFVDTVGRSQKAKKELAELGKIVTATKADEVHLVLSAQTNYPTLRQIVETFSAFEPTRLIFSKMDEAAIFGPLYNIMQKTKIPVSFFATGQAVPDDISVSDGMTFAKMLYQGTIANA
jgi:flagellar biosynthesis protein FlhF